MTSYRLWQRDPEENQLEEFTAKIMVRENLGFRRAYNAKVYARLNYWYGEAQEKGQVTCIWGPETLCVDVTNYRK